MRYMILANTNWRELFEKQTKIDTSLLITVHIEYVNDKAKQCKQKHITKFKKKNLIL